MNLKKIAILATGGTIAGVGEKGKNTGYVSGQIPAKNLVDSIDGLQNLADIFTEQICNVNSDDITDKILIKLSNRIQELQNDDSVAAIIVTHGTDTMDESAYFISLTVKCQKPVVFTGAMRPATAAEPDGPKNLQGAIKFALQEAIFFKRNFVWIYFANNFYSARLAQKCSASAINAMGVNFAGDDSTYNVLPEENYFDISNKTTLPQVNVIYFNLDANPKILEFAAEISEGIVIAGAGAGEFSESFAKTLSKINIPVVIASRINHGLVNLNKKLAPYGICAGRLPPQKAAILLRLALTATHKIDEIKRVFEI